MTERDIFLALLDLPDAAARSTFLAKACAGDAALRAQVESLLRSYDNVGNFLGKSALPPAQREGGETQQLGAQAVTDDSAVAAGNDFSFLAASPRPDSLGRLGHYEVLEVLGRGGFGIVFRAFDETLQRLVAIKVLAPQLAATSPARKRFLREARWSARVRHANVVQVHAVEEQPLPYLVMEFVPGETLQQRLNRTGPLEAPEVVRMGRQIAEGLAAAHATGLIHRDVKPANILIEAGPHAHVKISDFGLAQAADDASSSQSGFIAGTPMYMAPEQASVSALDHRADLFSLGSVLYAMCTGRPPFRAPTTLAVLKRVAEDTPRPIREIIPEAPPWLCDLIARLHAKQPEDRFTSAQEVADLLAQYLAEGKDEGGRMKDAPIHPSSFRLHPSSFCGRRWAAVAAVLLLLGGLGFAEATGVTDLGGTVIRLFFPEGTLVVEVDDPGVSVKIDGSDLVITGAGAREIRLKPGKYTVEASRDGKVVRQELVTVTKQGRQVVRVSQEAPPSEAKAARGAADAAAWERAVAGLPALRQVTLVVARLQELNPGYDGRVEPSFENGENGVVTGLKFSTEQVRDISPVRAFANLRDLNCYSPGGTKGKLLDLSALRGLPLTHLTFHDNPVWDLSPLAGMKLIMLHCSSTQVSDLSPLQGMPLEKLDCGFTRVADLSPLKGMKLREADFQVTKVADLAPLQGMPLKKLRCHGLQVSDLSPLKGMPLERLNCNACGLVSDLSPLKGMPLWELGIAHTKVTDLAPLRGMTTLKRLNLTGTASVSDLSPLQGIPLEHISLTPKNITQGLDILRDMKSLETINLGSNPAWPAAEFWTRYDKGEFKK